MTPHPPCTSVQLRKRFSYRSLAHPRNFRILLLQRGEEEHWKDRILSGSVVEASLDNVPEYAALSYTWGNPSSRDEIYIDGRVLGITQNCADALRRLLKVSAWMAIWVDSICIDQSGDVNALEERSRQVALMDEIYSKAIRVDVYLGPGNEKTDAAIKAIKELWVAFKLAWEAKESGLVDEGLQRTYDDIADTVLAPSREFPYGKLEPVLGLPWFKRVWVFQELVLSRRALFICGEQTLHPQILHDAADFRLLPYSRLTTSASIWRTFLSQHARIARQIAKHERGETLDVGLVEVLVIGFFLIATKPEDKIYGLYACAKRLGINMVVPDYTKPVDQLYLETMITCFQYNGNLNMLTMVEGSSSMALQLPSWVINYSGNISEWSSTSPPNFNDSFENTARKTGDTRCEWTFSTEGRRLIVLGRRVDQVAAVGEPWRLDVNKTLLGDTNRDSSQVMSSLLDCFVTWVDVALGTNVRSGRGHDAADKITAMSRLARLLINGRQFLLTKWDEYPEPPDKFDDFLYRLDECSRSTDVDLQSSLYQVTNNSLNVVNLHAMQYLLIWVWKQVFRTTLRASLGISSYSSRPGDLIVLFRGLTIPCLLRPCEEGFHFVGAAFVDGLMDETTQEAEVDAHDEWFVLI